MMGVRLSSAQLRCLRAIAEITDAGTNTWGEGWLGLPRPFAVTSCRVLERVGLVELHNGWAVRLLPAGRRRLLAAREG